MFSFYSVQSSEFSGEANCRVCFFGPLWPLGLGFEGLGFVGPWVQALVISGLGSLELRVSGFRV